MLPQPDDPKRRCPDVSKAKAMLRWNALVSLKDGLEKTLGYFERMLSKAL